MIIEFLKEEKCNEMFNLIKDCFNLEVMIIILKK